MPASPGQVDLSVVVPAKGELENLRLLLPQVQAILDGLGLAWEILVVVDAAGEAVADELATLGARMLIQRERGYGGALVEGFRHARGAWILTMDADLSHPPVFIADLWRQREAAGVLIASRYVPGGEADMPVTRYLLSRILNVVFSRGLSLGVRDMSSGFRMYRADALRAISVNARDFNVLQEILLKLMVDGWRVREVPFSYQPREHGVSHARVFKFGVAYARSFPALWRLRNSVRAADYDARAYDSAIPLQRYWQRTRLRHVTSMAVAGPVLDVGCGSSRILAALPAGSVGADVLFAKLRHLRAPGRRLVQATGNQLPFRDAAFPCVVCSQTIELLPKSARLLEELHRVLAPGGRLVVGTPDHGRWQWRATERLYRRVVQDIPPIESGSRYTRAELVKRFESLGYRVDGTRYILGAELILALRKPR